MRRVCFVTGIRAEYGLMRRTLGVLRDDPRLTLQIIATGVHLDAARGRTVDRIGDDGFAVDAVVPWPATQSAIELAAATGRATAGLAEAFERLASDVVLVVGDRVEALAAATAGHLSNRVVAHVHGGDRAAGQADDAMRHAITKLAHLHFAATDGSAKRLRKLGEDDWRITLSGSPGVEGLHDDAEPAATPGGPFALVALHPTRDDADAERATARRLAAALLDAGVPRLEVIWPNGDLGASGIVAAWQAMAGDARVTQHVDLPRPAFLRLMRDAALLAGNSSAGIIEAASFGTPVLDVGPRQEGREASGNVVRVADDDAAVAAAVREAWNHGSPRRWTGGNVYGGGDAGRRISDWLATFDDGVSLRRKLIAY